jgi:hypothetical protein
MRQMGKQAMCKASGCKALLLAAALAWAPAQAALQSDGFSRASEASLQASVEVPVAVVEALAAGGQFVVTGIDRVGGASVAVTVSAVGAAGAGASWVVEVSSEAAQRIGLVVGTAVVVSVLVTGWMISVAGEALCFIASPELRPQIHSRRIAG